MKEKTPEKQQMFWYRSTYTDKVKERLACATILY